LIINELVSNAMKYAFDEEKGTVRILLDRLDEGYLLCVEDNGKGYDPGRVSVGFGSQLVKTLVSHHLDGSVNVISSNKGTRTEVLF
jgi:two-component sensor histidine kinase